MYKFSIAKMNTEKGTLSRIQVYRTVKELLNVLREKCTFQGLLYVSPYESGTSTNFDALMITEMQLYQILAHMEPPSKLLYVYINETICIKIVCKPRQRNAFDSNLY